VAEATARQIHSVLILPDIGHVPMSEVPDVVAELMTAWPDGPGAEAGRAAPAACPAGRLPLLARTSSASRRLMLSASTATSGDES
jgi:hypothetical protein